MRNLTLAQVGCGYWGPNLLRNFSALPGCKVGWLVETDGARQKFAQTLVPGLKVTTDLREAITAPEVDGVVIATPAASHFAIASACLEAGKHVFVEKPLATKTSEVDILEQLAVRHNRVVMAGHTFLFNSAVRYVKKLIDQGELGQLRYIYSQRLNLGRVRSDIDALWNFAPHDISIIQYWLGDIAPLAVQRTGVDFLQSGIDDVVFLSVRYPNKVLANIHVSWVDPQKVRKMVIVGSNKMVVYDDVAEDKIMIYDKGVDRVAKLGENMDYDAPPAWNFNYRSGDILIPKIDWVEPLRGEAQHFADCIRQQASPLTGLAHARQVVSILEQATTCRT
jgi:predicted dehydrogenase